MNGDMLSQEEIDALLRGEPITPEMNSDSLDNHSVKDYLNEMEEDAIGELGNISFGSSATALSALLNQKVEITTPKVSIVDNRRLEEEFPHPYVAIKVKYTEGFSGVNILVIKQSDASIIADLMLGGDGTDPAAQLDEIHLSAVQEAMNQMMGSAATSMSSIFNKRVDISPPTIDLLNVVEGEGTENIPSQHLLVKVSFRLKIGQLIDSQIMQLLPIDFAKNLVHDLINQNEPSIDEQPPILEEQSIQEETFTIENQPVIEKSQYAQTEQVTQQYMGAERPVQSTTMQTPNVQSASFVDFDEQPQVNSQKPKNLDMLFDIPLQVTVELGKTRRSVKDILELGSGSIIELDKLAGEPVDILVNSKLIAKGEVVVIDENFGVRVTDIISQTDRLNNLK